MRIDHDARERVVAQWLREVCAGDAHFVAVEAHRLGLGPEDVTLPALRAIAVARSDASTSLMHGASYWASRWPRVVKYANGTWGI